MKFIEEHPDDAFVHICDPGDGRERHRSITFGSWIRNYESEIKIFRHTYNDPENNLYAGLVLKTDNPLKQFYVEAFDFTIADLYNKD